MKKMLIILFVTCMYISPIKANTTEDDVLDILIYDQPIIINGKTITFYPTFKDADKAYDAILKEFENLILELRQENNLIEFNVNSLTAYHNILLNKLASGVKLDKESFKLYTYLEAYLIKAENDKIREIYSEYKLTNNEMLLQELDLLTPYTSEKVYERERTFGTFYVNGAVAYANRYAYTPNPSYAYYQDGDCANFASQIVHSGGIPIYNNGNFETGWYPGSATWIRANRFANWYGIWNYNRKHEWFANNVSRGDFVALDYGSNGSWDHIGFVTEKADYVGTWTDRNGITSQYKDYRIAQHTANNNCWAAESCNNWDEAYYQNYSTYGIILTPR